MKNDELHGAIDRVVGILRDVTDHRCTAVEIVVTSEGYKINCQIESPERLRRCGITMRNLRGEWIRGGE